MEDSNLFVKKEVTVDSGRMLKRIQPAPQGKAAHRIRKRSNHVTYWFWEVEQKKSNHIMGQKTNPIGNRLGYIKGWDSNWYGGRNYGDKIAEDSKIRQYIGVELQRKCSKGCY